ncbi:hypothetical protein PAECIP111892_02628 [Paenibacillus auburnensis]|uniref:Bypass of forespore C C-terminal domain-containing protein n=1 Tax=Paenibacillus auburnensis TaxID=2905649 RepID=A0ABN8GEF5_9BACL|nr:hypothetical protein [Paenibacillus auburnensis]CAH1205109.1 hypothetical protein PAECIP111892_02628 [Paenibacillus auburnensis]
MNKKLIAISITLAAAAAIFLGVQNTKDDTHPMSSTPQVQKTYKLNSDQAKLVYYENVDEITNKATAIVVGKVAGEQQITDINDESSGTLLYHRAFTPVQIEKSFKGNFKEGDQILVSEDGVLINNVYETLEGYVKMNNANSYLLFLREVEPGKFAICGSYQGKFNVDKTSNDTSFEERQITQSQLNDLDYLGENSEHFKNLKEQALEKFLESN